MKDCRAFSPTAIRRDDASCGPRNTAVRRNVGFVLLGLCVAAATAASPGTGLARDRGQFASSSPELKIWFDGLKSGKGPCCSDADGSAVSDADWETLNGHYRVRLDGQWVLVPDEAVITEPNRVGRTMVWPLRGYGGLSIRCFMPGQMS